MLSALAILINDVLYALRDPFGFRPLILGKTEGGYIIASESAAIDTVSGEIIRDIAPGELVEVSPSPWKNCIMLS